MFLILKEQVHETILLRISSVISKTNYKKTPEFDSGVINIIISFDALCMTCTLPILF
jgi:hypothetical protein